MELFKKLLANGDSNPASGPVKASLRDSEARYRRLFETAQDGILIIDADTGRIIDVNPFLVSMLGYQRSDFIGKALWRFGPFKDIRANRAAFKDLIRDGYIRYEHLPLETRDGRSIEVEFISNVYRVGRQRTIQCNIRDNSQRKQAERARLRLESQILEAHETAAIEKLAGGIAHHFNNALTVIKGALSLIEKDTLPTETGENLRHINRAAERMIKLTRDMLAYANGGKYHIETMTLSHLVRDSLPLFVSVLEPSIALETDLPSGLPPIQADKLQIQTALLAILANASEAIEIQGLIRIICRIVDGTDGSLEPSAGLAPGRYVSLIVMDNGKGMDPETRRRVFEPFFTNHFHGRGLGMAAVYGIVKNHGGHILVESQIDVGTEVHVYFPAMKSVEETTLRSRLPLPNVQQGASGSAR
jgi:two-component system cell cycle sensor histidine kinase/response regulator CckA